uniref:Uncharacterized protein n=1 Tax=Glossina austeni TaxID=7395 RepID=A0A1A9UQY1_GLOAU
MYLNGNGALPPFLSGLTEMAYNSPLERVSQIKVKLFAEIQTFINRLTGITLKISVRYFWPPELLRPAPGSARSTPLPDPLMLHFLPLPPLLESRGGVAFNITGSNGEIISPSVMPLLSNLFQCHSSDLLLKSPAAIIVHVTFEIRLCEIFCKRL